MQVGDIIKVRAPAGGFTIDALESRPAVLLAAGVGITPMLSMVRTIVFEGLRKPHIRKAYLFVAARNLAERAFDREISDLLRQAGGAVQVIRILGDGTGANEGEHYDRAGRIDADLLRATLPFDGYDFYMCGPQPFMQGLYDQLRALGTPDDWIHAEAFGPASLTRSTDRAAPELPAASETPVPVAFTKSGNEARWEPGSGSRLELAEARGLTPEFSCRTGNCGTCATKILAGQVTYASAPQAKVDDDTALICCAVPAYAGAGSGDRLILDL